VLTMLYRRLPRFHPKGFNMGELHNSTLHSTPFRLCTKKACGELVRGEAGNEGTNLTLEGLSEKAWLEGRSVSGGCMLCASDVQCAVRSLRDFFT
jgi:hypothetical protein